MNSSRTSSQNKKGTSSQNNKAQKRSNDKEHWSKFTTELTSGIKNEEIWNDHSPFIIGDEIYYVSTNNIKSHIFTSKINEYVTDTHNILNSTEIPGKNLHDALTSLYDIISFKNDN